MTHERITVLEAELERAARHNADLKEEVELLRETVKKEGEKNRGLWRLHCEKLVEYDEQIASKEERIEDLESQVAALETATHERGSRHLQGAEPQERAWWPKPHDSDTLGGSLVPRAAREPSRPIVSGSDPARKYSSYAVAGSTSETKASRKTYKNHAYCKSQSYPCRGSAKGQSASSRLVQLDDWYQSL